ncbi:uncharacterized protein LOC126747393 [Anthonomus grandis grandis]|nr:uncharacterized protein LOC126747393 [Anthonomus grandis grandis]
MVFIISSVLIGIILKLTGAAPAVQYYASKYDHIDVEAILNNRRMVNYYSACLLNKGPCPPEGVDLKRILPEALQTNCSRCSEKQATVALRAIKRLRKEYPKIWSQLTEQWDPNDVFVRKFETSFGKKSGKPRPIEEASPAATNSINNSIPDNRKPEFSTTTTQGLPSAITTKITTTSSKPFIPSSSSIRSSISQTTLRPSTTFITPSSVRPSSPSATPPSTSSRPSSTPFRPIPNLLPINTFFTNPPIPIRPIVNLNIGATVKAIKQVEKAVAEVALEKIGFIKNMFLLPWKRDRNKFKSFFN